jgi:hypothetical protein
MNPVQLTFDRDFEQVVLRMPVEPEHCARLRSALDTGVLQHSHYFGFTGDPVDDPTFFIDAFVEVEGRKVYLFATEEQDEIRMSVSARNLNGLDYTDFRPDMDGAWVDFVQPLRKILEILQ